MRALIKAELVVTLGLSIFPLLNNKLPGERNVVNTLTLSSSHKDCSSVYSWLLYDTSIYLMFWYALVTVSKSTVLFIRWVLLDWRAVMANVVILLLWDKSSFYYFLVRLSAHISVNKQFYLWCMVCYRYSIWVRGSYIKHHTDQPITDKFAHNQIHSDQIWQVQRIDTCFVLRDFPAIPSTSDESGDRGGGRATPRSRASTARF